MLFLIMMNFVWFWLFFFFFAFCLLFVVLQHFVQFVPFGCQSLHNGALRMSNALQLDIILHWFSIKCSNSFVKFCSKSRLSYTLQQKKRKNRESFTLLRLFQLLLSCCCTKPLNTAQLTNQCVNAAHFFFSQRLKYNC